MSEINRRSFVFATPLAALLPSTLKKRVKKYPSVPEISVIERRAISRRVADVLGVKYSNDYQWPATTEPLFENQRYAGFLHDGTDCWRFTPAENFIDALWAAEEVGLFGQCSGQRNAVLECHYPDMNPSNEPVWVCRDPDEEHGDFCESAGCIPMAISLAILKTQPHCFETPGKSQSSDDG